MKHIIVAQHGTNLGLSGNMLSVVTRIGGDKKNLKFPLNRLSTVSISKRGVGISSDLIQALSIRGIKLFFLDYRGVAHTALISAHQHAVVRVRMSQMKACEYGNIQLARQFVYGKIRNQRATLLYVNKYHQDEKLVEVATKLQTQATNALYAENTQVLLGIEGFSSRIYFQSLISANLMPSTFQGREGRGSSELGNAMLNLGYAILSSRILNAVTNAGLEPYLGCFHKQRPGRPALILDLMEEYRSWVVDRTVIKFRSQAVCKNSIDDELKVRYIQEIQATFERKYWYRKQRVKLESIIQRQVYKLSGNFQESSTYRPYLFKW